MQFNDSVPTPLSSFTTPPSSGSEAPKHSKKKPKNKVNKEKNKRKKAEFKCAELKYKRKADKKLAAERQRSYELSCKLKFQRQLIHTLYPDLDKKLGELCGGEDLDES